MTKSFPESCYKRIQRFFRFFKFDPFTVASMVITLFGLKNKKLAWSLIAQAGSYKENNAFFSLRTQFDIAQV